MRCLRFYAQLRFSELTIIVILVALLCHIIITLYVMWPSSHEVITYRCSVLQRLIAGPSVAVCTHLVSCKNAFPVYDELTQGDQVSRMLPIALSLFYAQV